jgi:hypothetical protein
VAFLTSTQINWSEPWLFLIRIRERPAWIKRIGLALALSLVMFLAIYFGGRHAAWSLPQAIGFGFLCGFTLVLLFDVPNLQRDVTVKDDCIIVGNSFGRGNYSTFEFKHVEAVELLRPDDWKRPWGAMLIEIPGDTFLVAVPPKVSLETVANILHRLDVPVALRGWEPSPQKDTRVQVEDEIVIDAKDVRGVASITPVEPSEPKLTPVSCMIVQVLVAAGPAILSLIGMIAAGIWIAVGWKTLPVLTKVLAGGGAFAAFVVSVVWLIHIGQFIANSYAVSVGEKQLRLRPGSLFRGDETNLTPVEVYDRSVWTAVLFKSLDSGFLQVDAPRRMLRFEGEKNRWEIPASALTSCRIEHCHVGSEANQNAEQRFLVAIAAQQNGEPWEVGLMPTRTAIGSNGIDQRSAHAKSLFQQIAAAVA